MSGYNRNFVPARWWKLVTLHWAEQRRQYLLVLLAIAGVLFGWFSFVVAIDLRDPMGMKYQYSAYYVGLILLGCLYGSMLFSDLSHKTRSIQYLSVPASQFEKLLCALFFGVLLFFIGYTLLFYLVDAPMVGLANRVMTSRVAHKPYLAAEMSYPASVYNIFANKNHPLQEFDFNFFMVAFFALQSVFILGSVYFVRYSYVKTVVSLLLFLLVGLFFIIKVIDYNIPPGWHLGKGLLEWSQWDTSFEPFGQKLVRSPSWIGDSLGFLLKYCIPLVFWSITYIRLKEKEV